MNSSGKIKLKLFRAIALGLAITAFGLWVVDDVFKSSVINDYLLITKKKAVTKGFITKAEEFTETIEDADLNPVGEATGYLFEYTFTLPDGQEIKSSGDQYRELPLEKSLNDIPYEIEIEYLSDNPKINRVKGLWSNEETVMSWFRKNILKSLIVFLIILAVGIFYVKNAIKQYQLAKLGMKLNY